MIFCAIMRSKFSTHLSTKISRLLLLLFLYATVQDLKHDKFNFCFTERIVYIGFLYLRVQQHEHKYKKFPLVVSTKFEYTNLSKS